MKKSEVYTHLQVCLFPPQPYFNKLAWHFISHVNNYVSVLTFWKYPSPVETKCLSLHKI